MSEPTNNELYIMMKNGFKRMDDGFIGVHERQDKTNGNVKPNTEHRIAQQTTNMWMKVLFVSVIIPLGIVIFKTFL